MTPGSAFLIGGIAGLACYWGATGLKRLLGADDSLDVFGVHGIGGIVGSILTGVFATKTISGLDASVVTQLIGVSAVLLYSVFMGAVVLGVTQLITGLRVDEQSELAGMDIAQHRERIGT